MGSFPIVPSTGWNPGSQDTIMIVITQLICTICYADLYTYWESSCLTGLYNILCRLVHLTVWLYCQGCLQYVRTVRTCVPLYLASTSVATQNWLTSAASWIQKTAGSRSASAWCSIVSILMHAAWSRYWTPPTGIMCHITWSMMPCAMHFFLTSSAARSVDKWVFYNIMPK